MWKPPLPTPIFPISQMLVPGLEHGRDYGIMSVVLDDSGRFHPLIPLPHPASATHISVIGQEKQNQTVVAGCVSGALQSVLVALAPPAEARTFQAPEMPPAAFPEVTHQGAPGAPRSGNAARPAGVFKSAGAAARGAAAGFLVGRAGTWGGRPPPACPSPFLGRDATEITRSSGRAGPGGGGTPGERAPGRWASSPARRHPGDPGAPSSR